MSKMKKKIADGDKGNDDEMSRQPGLTKQA